MGFNEKTHTFILGAYFKHLTETFGERGKRAFILATRYYGEQRGRRMAQKVIRDGGELTFKNYLIYSEWEPSEELASQGKVNSVKVTSFAPDYKIEIYSCPWAETFEEMGLKEAGKTYCTYLDTSIARGFNPDIAFSVPKTMYESGFCLQEVKNSCLTAASFPKKKEYVRDFLYHTAHAYFSFREIAEGIFKEEGKKIADKVLEDFLKSYGEDMTGELLKFKDEDFNKA